MTLVIKLLNPEIESVSANRFPTDAHLGWSVGVAPESELAAGPEQVLLRVVIGTLQCFGEHGAITVNVSALLKQTDGELSGLAELIDSDELETLYDIARAAVLSSAALVQVAPDVPRKAPTPELGFLVRADQSE